MPFDVAAVVDAFLGALAADQRIDLFQQVGNRKLFILQAHTPGFDARHIQDVVDQMQQMLGRVPDFFQIFFRGWGKTLFAEGDIIQTDDGVHGGTDFVAHVGKERGFGFVCFLSYRKRVAERLILCHVLPGFLVNIRKAHTNRMDDVVLPVLRMTDAGHANHLVGFFPVPVHKVTVADYETFFQRRPYGFRVNKVQETFPVTVCNKLFRILGK